MIYLLIPFLIPIIIFVLMYLFGKIKSKKTKRIIISVILIGVLIYFSSQFIRGYCLMSNMRIFNASAKQEVILEKLGITMPQGAKLGKCYKRVWSKHLLVEITDIEDIGDALDNNFLKEKGTLDSVDKEALKKWFENPEIYLGVSTRWPDSDYFYDKNRILNYLESDDDGPWYQFDISKYGEHQGFYFDFRTKKGLIHTFMYKNKKDKYNIVILKKSVDSGFLKKL